MHVGCVISDTLHAFTFLTLCSHYSCNLDTLQTASMSSPANPPNSTANLETPPQGFRSSTCTIYSRGGWGSAGNPGCAHSTASPSSSLPLVSPITFPVPTS